MPKAKMLKAKKGTADSEILNTIMLHQVTDADCILSEV